MGPGGRVTVKIGMLGVRRLWRRRGGGGEGVFCVVLVVMVGVFVVVVE